MYSIRGHVWSTARGILSLPYHQGPIYGPHTNTVSQGTPSDTLYARIMICSDLVFNYIATRRRAGGHQQRSAPVCGRPPLTAASQTLPLPSSRLTFISLATDSQSFIVLRRYTIRSCWTNLCFPSIIYRHTVGLCDDESFRYFNQR